MGHTCKSKRTHNPASLGMALKANSHSPRQVALLAAHASARRRADLSAAAAAVVAAEQGGCRMFHRLTASDGTWRDSPALGSSSSRPASAAQVRRTALWEEGELWAPNVLEELPLEEAQGAQGVTEEEAMAAAEEGVQVRYRDDVRYGVRKKG